MHIFGVLFIVIGSSLSDVLSQDSPSFHLDLSPEDRLHYFGTELLDDVPHYEYTSPQPVDRRRRRSADDTADDNLEYLIQAFGETTHLLLDKNKELISPGCIVQRYKANGTSDVSACAKEEVDCFYTGRSTNHTNSWVALSVCGGMNGVIGTSEKTLVIQPIREKHVSRARRYTSLIQPHIIYHYSQNKQVFVSPEKLSDSTDYTRRSRRRRSTSRRYVETAVVADPTVYRFHGKDTELMIKTIMNVVAERFLDASLKNTLYFTLNKIVILEHDQAGLHVEVNSGNTLNSFCQWSSTWNPVADSNPLHADYTLLITKVDLEHLGNKANSGLARKGMCGEKTSCSVNEDSGLGTGLTVSHETGHVLGMNHDSEGNTCANGKNIMASLAPSGPEAFKWSSCSAEAVRHFLSSSKSSCLNDVPPTQATKLYSAVDKPGTIYSVNHQCQMMLGPEAEVCEGTHGQGQDVCGEIVCRPRHDTGVHGCVIYSAPRMDGTDCGNRKWCIQGQCVAMGPSAPGPINGGWSDWSVGYGACSRSCGGGVKTRRRFCNNPEPMYGGGACAGSDTMGELCNMQDCTTSQSHFLSEQCTATDNKPIQGRTYNWEPNTNAMGDDSCKISCHAAGTQWYAKRGISTDGSECINDRASAFSKCVAGKCKSFGCDGHMESGHVFDKCGTCNGKGDTCRKLTGNFHGGHAHVYTTFVRIPTGSTGITLTQGNGYCSLSVTVSGQALFTASTPHLSGTYNKAGVIIKYQSKPERLEIIGPTNAVVEAQVYRQYGPPYVGVDPDVYYEYHVPTTSQGTSTYMWKTRAGTCNKSCGTGSQTPTITCVNSNSGTVDDYLCNINQKPKETTQSCNTHACPPRWRTSAWGQCTKTCGGGQRHRTTECVQENNNVETVLSASRCHNQHKPTTSSSCNSDACPGTWKAGSWTQCSEACARGVKTRHVKCYSSSASTTPIDDAHCHGASKPVEKDYCVVKPCNTDVTGAACKDKVDNCFGTYGQDVCNGQYKGWSHGNCMKSCGVCAEHAAVVDSGCKDKVDNCAHYTEGFCTNSAYAAWAKNNCQKYCGYCGGAAATTTPVPAAVDPSCQDTDNCPAYGANVCTQYAGWAKTHCKKFCSLCELTEAKPRTVHTAAVEHLNICENSAACEAFGKVICDKKEFAQQHCRKYCGLCAECVDQESNCAGYGSSMCTQYKPWATAHCQGYCGLCDARRKRDVSDVIAPPPPGANELPPPLKDDISTDLEANTIETSPEQDDVLVEEARASDDDVIDDEAVVDDATGYESELAKSDDITNTADENIAPEEPVCNTVRTSATGSLDIMGKLLPGTPCDQVIALPLDSRVLITFDVMNVGCDSGDDLTIVDGVSGQEIPVCNSVLSNKWLSTGSVAILKFTAGIQGHGYAFSYEAYPQNKTITACSQHFTAAVGEITTVSYPASAKHADDTCEIYVTGTPGKSVQLIFNSFHMAGEEGNCETANSVVVEDLEGGEVDILCGELSPFIWESRGSRIRLVYNQSSTKHGFSAAYSVQDL